MFEGREAPLRFLNSQYISEGSQIVVFYGRKGLGKTTLLRRFAQDKPYYYYLGRSCSEKEQRFQWCLELRGKGAGISDEASYSEILDACFPAEHSAKKVFIIDEFHFFVKSDPSFFPELIQYSKNSKPALIILCTSATGWVENSMIARIGRAAAALSGLWKMHEYRYSEMKTLFPEYPEEFFHVLYGILGGNPGLWNCFSASSGIRPNIISEILSPRGRLREAAYLLLAEELRETAVYHTILAGMASGKQKLNELHLHTGFSRAKISVYLKNLMELDLVEKVSSFDTPGEMNTQKGIYRISHPFVDFYFRVLFPNLSALEQLSPEEFYDEYVEKALPFYEENAYRKLCREKLSAGYSEIGEWFGKEGHIHLLGRNAEGQSFCAQCYFRGRPGMAEQKALLKNLRQAKWKPDRIYYFCEDGVEKDLEKIIAKEKEAISWERIFI